MRPIHYPTSDGEPLGETDAHRQQIIDLLHALEHYYRKRDDVYVSGNILMFHEEGNNRKHRSPDVLVTFGIPKRERLNYKIWEEGQAPDLVFEITSASTRFEDLGEKKGLYNLLGVQEYVMFDPLNEYLEPRLRVYRKSGEDYLPVTGQPLLLQTVGLALEIHGERLRLRDPATGYLLPTGPEVQALADAERQRAEAERQRADSAEAEVQRLREELAKRDLHP